MLYPLSRLSTLKVVIYKILSIQQTLTEQWLWEWLLGRGNTKTLKSSHTQKSSCNYQYLKCYRVSQNSKEDLILTVCWENVGGEGEERGKEGGRGEKKVSLNMSHVGAQIGHRELGRGGQWWEGQYLVPMKLVTKHTVECRVYSLVGRGLVWHAQSLMDNAF